MYFVAMLVSIPVFGALNAGGKPEIPEVVPIVRDPLLGGLESVIPPFENVATLGIPAVLLRALRALRLNSLRLSTFI